MNLLSAPAADTLCVAPPDDSWTLLYPASHPGGPLSFRLGTDELLRDCGCRVDDLADAAGIATEARCRRRGVTALVTQAGYYPFGRQISFRANTFHGARHLRRVVDVRWPGGAVVRRQFDLDSLRLPGPWARLLVLPSGPPAAGTPAPAWQPLPAAAGTGEVRLALWPRPPLALVFERPDGTRLEIGTGVDLWRWEAALGAGAGTGRFALFQDAGGLRLERVPLAPAAEFAPAGRDYRFSWYAAWQTAAEAAVPPPPIPAGLERLRFRDNGDAVLPGTPAPGRRRRPAKKPAAPPPPPCYLVDFTAMPGLPAEAHHAPSPAAYCRGERGPGLCWESGVVQKHARRLIRQLAGRGGTAGTLVFRGLDPAPCWDPAHVDRQNPNGLAHWDITGILDFAEWTRQTLGPAWTLAAEPAAGAPPRPVLAGLFAPPAFTAVPLASEPEPS